MRILAIALSMVPGHATSSSLSSMSLTSENRDIRGQQDLLLVACQTSTEMTNFPDHGRMATRNLPHAESLHCSNPGGSTQATPAIRNLLYKLSEVKITLSCFSLLFLLESPFPLLKILLKFSLRVCTLLMADTVLITLWICASFLKKPNIYQSYPVIFH